MLRLLIGLLLIPCCLGLTRTVVTCAGASAVSALADGARPFLMLVGGMVAAAFVFLVLPTPVRLYVLAHELTHALSGALSGARVSGLRVSAKGGKVKLSQSNWLIALAPYFFPLYTVVVILAYYLGLIFFDLRPYAFVWLGLVGFTLGFHFAFTLSALAQGQPDVRAYGRLFSFSLIYLLNMLVICGVLLLGAPITLAELCRRLASDQAGIWHAGYRALVAAVELLSRLL